MPIFVFLNLIDSYRKPDKLIAVRVLLFCFLLFKSFHGECQNAEFEISTDGLDSIKIGMSIGEVEKVVKVPLEVYNGSTSTIKDHDSAITAWGGCKNCTPKYICRYEGVTLILTFLKPKHYQHPDYELVAISQEPPTSLIHTKTGIKVGISEDKLIEICKRNNYPYDKTAIDSNTNGYLFSDRLNRYSGKTLIARCSNKRLVDLLVINMIGGN
jgi:hypothetical protein